MTNWPPVRGSACSQSWTRSAGSRPSSIQGSAIGQKTWLRPLKARVHPRAIRRRSGSIRAPSLSAGPRSLGLREGRHAGLLTARQTYRQRLHRGLQRPPARRVPERALVSDPCRRPRKVGGLARVLQRGSTAWGNRQQAPGVSHDSRRRIQPAGVTKPENSTFRRSNNWERTNQLRTLVMTG